MGDEIQSINGIDFNSKNANATIVALYKISKPGDSVLVVVKRKKEGSDEKEDVTLSGQMMKLPVRKYNLLNFKTDITPQQKLVQDSWLAAAQ